MVFFLPPPLFWGVGSTWIFLTYPEWVFIKVRRFTFHHFNGHDPQRPDINFWTISFSSYHLRCHPVRSPHHSASFTLLRSDLSTEPKISCREEKSIKMSPNNFFCNSLFSHVTDPSFNVKMLTSWSWPDPSATTDFKGVWVNRQMWIPFQ